MKMATVSRDQLDMTLLDESYRLKQKWIEQVCAGGQFEGAEMANFAGSDLRSAKAFADMCRPKTEIAENCKRFLKTFQVEPTQYDPGIVTQSIKEAVIGLCPHHFLPVNYEVYVSYIPNKKAPKVLGLSKLTRIAREIPKFPMLQEEYARNLADVLYKGNSWLEGIDSDGSAVMVIGRHGCMACRGVLSNGLTSSTVVRGYFEEASMEQRFYTQVQNIKTSCFTM